VNATTVGDSLVEETNTTSVVAQARLKGGKKPVGRPVRVLVVGQTPPPLVGQSIMIEKMIHGTYSDIEIFHVRMAFSSQVNQIGRFSLGKAAHLFSLIIQIWVAGFRHQIDVLYYPPAGPNRIPVYRDIVILLMTRWIFKSLVFHFHAGGISDIYPKLSWLMKPLFRRAYHGAEIGIRLTYRNPDDSSALKTVRDIVIPNGIDDRYEEFAKQRPVHSVPVILFVGMVCEQKGIFLLLEACRQLKQTGLPFKLRIVGAADSATTTTAVNDFIKQHNLIENVELSGVLNGDDKWDAFASADIFCLPTHYVSESFGLVMIEAMQFELPVVATDWRGISTIVNDGESGFLVPTHCSEAIAEKLSILIQNPDLARKMGQRGRQRFLADYTIEKFYENIQRAFCDAAAKVR
jgi:glycosyltransferase involved in cell wall biosynthesis